MKKYFPELIFQNDLIFASLKILRNYSSQSAKQINIKFILKMGEQLIKNIVIIEDESEIRNFFQLSINQESKLKVVNAYDNCEEAIANVTKDKPDLVLMDIKLPGINGIQGTQKIKSIYPNTEVIIITAFDDSDLVFEALKSGASGYLTKNITPEKLVAAIHESINGGSPMSTNIARLVVSSFRRTHDSPLSPRESEILTLIAEGKTYKSTSEKLFISKETVKFHLKNIYLKLQVNSKTEAIKIANDHKYI